MAGREFRRRVFDANKEGRAIVADADSVRRAGFPGRYGATGHPFGNATPFSPATLRNRSG